ncbi:YhcN/YlaJ family sporulation lipoprotein [Virgibacillus sp. JSM 102003]|uniref:YhcN/YlaJ family sporulation lipoprotein n=1 Tax=Virgibacillus sp. JSM 102003 TaxID=1562108 RepID=UPI0035C23273
MNAYRFLFIVGMILFLIGCSPNTDSSQSGPNNGVNFTNISTKGSLDQSISNNAKQSLSQHKEITTINAVNTEKILVIAFEVHHNKRFQLAKLRKKMHKKLEKVFPDQKVELSTDKKIVIETNRLENKIRQGDISKKNLKKEVKHLIKLMNEQT